METLPLIKTYTKELLIEAVKLCPIKQLPQLFEYIKNEFIAEEQDLFEKRFRFVRPAKKDNTTFKFEDIAQLADLRRIRRLLLKLIDTVM